MHFKHAISALAGLTALASAAPAALDKDIMPIEKGLRHKTRAQKRAPLIIQQTVVEPNIVVVEQNLDTINNLAVLAEQEFAALVQAQVALIQQVETIKNNIRVNTFRSRFQQVNTVIVTVTQVVDSRNRDARNNRYLVNQLLADNGRPDREVVVMITAADAMTIGLPTPSLDIAGILASASAVSGPTATPQIAAFDPAAPFGQSNQSLILPFGSPAPSLPNGAQIFADPAAIILPGGGASGQNLFVEDISAFSTDCALWGANGNSLFNLQSALLAAEQVAAAQLAGLVLGGGLDGNLADQLLNGKGRDNNNNNNNKDNNNKGDGKNGKDQAQASASASASSSASAGAAEETKKAEANPAEG